MEQHERPEDTGRESSPLPAPPLDAQPSAAAVNQAAIEAHIDRVFAAASSLDCKLVVFGIRNDHDSGAELDRPIGQYRPDQADAAKTDIVANASLPGANIYLSLAAYRSDLPEHAKGGEADVIAALGVVLDVDHLPAGQDLQDVLPMPPDYVLQTSEGRYQAGYLFDCPAPPAQAKMLAKALTASTACDPVSADISHVWRIPGTLNWPNEKKIAAGRRGPQPVAVREYADAPGTMIDRLARSIGCDLHAPPPDALRQDTEPNSDEAPTHIPVWLRNLMNQTSGADGDRSDHLFHVVAELIGLGLGDAPILALMRAHPFGEKYAERSDQDARREITRIRAKSDEGARRSSNPAFGASSSAGSRIYTRSEIAVLPPPEYLIDPLIPRRGLVCLAGESGIGKSFVALDMALCIATGRDFHDLLTEAGRTVYLAAEGSGGFHARIAAWEVARRLKVPDDRFGMYAAPVQLNSDDYDHFASLVEDFVRTFGPVDLIVVDTLARCLAGSEIEERDLKALMVACGRLSGRFGCSVLLVHHPAKANADARGAHAVRGHGSLYAALDSSMSLKRDPGGSNVRVLHHDKCKDDEPAKSIHLALRTISLASIIPPRRSGKTPTSLVFDLVDASAGIAPSKGGRRVSADGQTAEAAVLERLKDGAAETADLIAATRVRLADPSGADSKVRSALDRLKRQGRIEQIIRGQYALSESERSEATPSADDPTGYPGDIPE